MVVILACFEKAALKRSIPVIFARKNGAQVLNGDFCCLNAQVNLKIGLLKVDRKRVLNLMRLGN
jgi:hypothetical protein